ncbi:hypothetical protein U0070_003641 [Myodes glareolus]|uniref:Uncharacterized protein n=1 Tax=Myodes glareolus TaxID=447135 RepID=A0AAW0HG88_MYOGA
MSVDQHLSLKSRVRSMVLLGAAVLRQRLTVLRLLAWNTIGCTASETLPDWDTLESSWEAFGEGELLSGSLISTSWQADCSSMPSTSECASRLVSSSTRPAGRGKFITSHCTQITREGNDGVTGIVTTEFLLLRLLLLADQHSLSVSATCLLSSLKKQMPEAVNLMPLQSHFLLSNDKNDKSGREPTRCGGSPSTTLYKHLKNDKILLLGARKTAQQLKGWLSKTNDVSLLCGSTASTNAEGQRQSCPLTSTLLTESFLDTAPTIPQQRPPQLRRRNSLSLPRTETSRGRPPIGRIPANTSGSSRPFPSDEARSSVNTLMTLQPTALSVSTPMALQPTALSMSTPMALQPTALSVSTPVAQQPTALSVSTPVAQQPTALSVSTPVALQPTAQSAKVASLLINSNKTYLAVPAQWRLHDRFGSAWASLQRPHNAQEEGYCGWSGEGGARPCQGGRKAEKGRGKDKSSDKKRANKRKRGAKGKQVEMADQQTTDLPAENRETESRSSASEEEEEEANSN